MAISEFCHRDVVCATRETTVTEAANLMRQHHIGDVVIIGIVTDRDIVVEFPRPACGERVRVRGARLTHTLRDTRSRGNIASGL
jgi:CBS domain-containing protein